MAESSTHLQYIQEKLGRRVLDTLVFRGDDILILDRAGLRKLSFSRRMRDSVLISSATSPPWTIGKSKSRASRWSIRWFPEGRAKASVRVPVPEDDAVESLTPLWQGQIFSNGKFGTYSASALSIIRICGGFCSAEEFQGHPLRKIIRSIFGSHGSRRKVEGTFVDERSQNKLLRLKQALGNKG